MKIAVRAFISSAVGFVLLCTSLAAADFSGNVVGIIDGDPLEVLNGHHTERIRLSGIDCPEKAQACRL
jgi:endonuclease YncB( thermonuclease family)